MEPFRKRGPDRHLSTGIDPNIGKHPWLKQPRPAAPSPPAPPDMAQPAAGGSPYLV